MAAIAVHVAVLDLDRLRLMRKCGQDFVARRDAYVRAFDSSCSAPDRDVEQMAACGLELRTKYGFPDAQCPTESPLSEFDLVDALAAAAGNASRLRILGVPIGEPRQAAPRPSTPAPQRAATARAATTAESSNANEPAEEGDAATREDEAETPIRD